MRFTICLLFFPALAFTQQETSTDIMARLPVKDGTLFYENVFLVDSTIHKDKIFNAAKQSLIKSTNYKYSKIDEDRVSGNISTEINYLIKSNPGIAKIVFNCTSTLSIDCKDGKFRIQIYNSSAEWAGLKETAQNYFDYCKDEKIKDSKKSGRKRMLHDWDQFLTTLISSLSQSIQINFRDDDF